MKPITKATFVGPGKSMKRKLFLRAALTGLALCIYPVCVIAYTWINVLHSDFKGGRNGQLDAYRHTLASATVSYTLGEWAVHLTTWASESERREAGRMDIHNNRIGAAIGSKVESFSAIEPAVHKAVLNGTASAVDPDQITWLPSSRWAEGRFW